MVAVIWVALLTPVCKTGAFKLWGGGGRFDSFATHSLLIGGRKWEVGNLVDGESFKNRRTNIGSQVLRTPASAFRIPI